MTLISPYGDRPSAELQSLVTTGLLSIQPGPAYHLVLEFDHGTQGKRVDVRPDLPVQFEM